MRWSRHSRQFDMEHPSVSESRVHVTFERPCKKLSPFVGMGYGMPPYDLIEY